MNNDQLFNEIYGVYYQAVTEIINRAIAAPISRSEIEEIISKYAFSDTSFLLSSVIGEERYYPVLQKRKEEEGASRQKSAKEEYVTPIKRKARMPLTLLEKRWLKTISEDPRVKLFDCVFPPLSDVKPLYERSSIRFCGEYSLGDDYSSEEYIRIFKRVFQATKEKRYIYIRYVSPKVGVVEDVFEPISLQYSTKENRFRLFAYPRGRDLIYMINLSRITEASVKDVIRSPRKGEVELSYVELIFKRARETPQRLLLYFSNYERQTKKLDENHFSVKIAYPKADESEVLVNLLSFVPMVKVVAPEQMKEKFDERIRKQKELLPERKKTK